MATIEVDFDVFKELTMRRASESVTYNEVIRGLLNLGSDNAAKADVGGAFKGLVYKGVFFPEGTRFRATYRGKTYSGEIKNERWVDGAGNPQSSPSAAAYAITRSGINGWRFWECKRPSDSSWTLIDSLR